MIRGSDCVMIYAEFHLTDPLTFSADLDGAGGSDLMAVLVPLPSNLLQRDLTHENSILVLLNVKVLQILDYLQLVFCDLSKKNQPVGGGEAAQNCGSVDLP